VSLGFWGLNCDQCGNPQREPSRAESSRVSIRAICGAALALGHDAVNFVGREAEVKGRALGYVLPSPTLVPRGLP